MKRVSLLKILTVGVLFLCIFCLGIWIAGSLQRAEETAGKRERGGQTKEDREASEEENKTAEEERSRYGNYTVVVDAGHGGNDPGKVGNKGLLEKDVNLEIAGLLERRLSEAGINVVMTRREDVRLGEENVSNEKMEDLNERLRIISECSPVLVVSIHQNSFTDAAVRGPQVFYHGNSAEGKRAAECIQEKLNGMEEVTSPRVSKSNDTYYLLKKTEAPMVIAECAFLSNPAEEELLGTEAYREAVADAITAGVLEYLDGINFIN